MNIKFQERYIFKMCAKYQSFDENNEINNTEYGAVVRAQSAAAVEDGDGAAGFDLALAGAGGGHRAGGLFCVEVSGGGVSPPCMW